MQSSGAGKDSGAAGDSAPALQKRKHLRRLAWMYETCRAPLFFLTVCTRRRCRVLADPAACGVLVSAWRDALDVYGWTVGRYVIMPDHVHFFAAPATRASKDTSGFVGGWKNWTAQRLRESHLPRFAWQHEFFDHLLRSAESYEEKWEYVRANPVRAGLVVTPNDWPYQGEVHAVVW